nr:hypothetical protein [uncultured Rhodopila sp.]
MGDRPGVARMHRLAGHAAAEDHGHRQEQRVADPQEFGDGQAGAEVFRDGVGGAEQDDRADRQHDAPNRIV